MSSESDRAQLKGTRRSLAEASKVTQWVITDPATCTEQVGYLYNIPFWTFFKGEATYSPTQYERALPPTYVTADRGLTWDGVECSLLFSHITVVPVVLPVQQWNFTSQALTSRWADVVATPSVPSIFVSWFSLSGAGLALRPYVRHAFLALSRFFRSYRSPLQYFSVAWLVGGIAVSLVGYIDIWVMIYVLPGVGFQGIGLVLLSALTALSNSSRRDFLFGLWLTGGQLMPLLATAFGLLLLSNMTTMGFLLTFLPLGVLAMMLQATLCLHIGRALRARPRASPGENSALISD